MIYILAGHTADKKSPNYDPGAVANGHVEADLAVLLRIAISLELTKMGVAHKTDDDRDRLSSVISKMVSKPTDVIFDIHFNSGPETANGVECFVPERHTTLEHASAKGICASISALTGIRNRGVKVPSQSARKSLAIMKPEGTNILIEMCFITNKSDMEKYLSNFQMIARALAHCLIQIEKAE